MHTIATKILLLFDNNTTFSVTKINFLLFKTTEF